MSSLKWQGMRITVAVKQEWKSLTYITIGCIILTAGIMGLTVPYKLPDSGLTGLAVLGKYAFGLSPAWIIGIGNVGLLWWSWKELSPRFVILTAYGVGLLTLLVKLADNLPHPTIHDTLLVAMLAGVIKGIGGGIVFRCGASLGGTDIIVMVLRKRLGVEVGKYSFYINLVILALSALVVGIEGALFGLVSVYANGVVTDNVLSSFDRRRLVLVVSREHKAIANYIIREMNRGVTELMGKGGYSGEDRPTLMCLLTPKQTMDLKRFVAHIDPKAFMVVSEASEVLGRGFKEWKRF